jgi:hypothetical protein
VTHGSRDVNGGVGVNVPAPGMQMLESDHQNKPCMALHHKL